LEIKRQVSELTLSLQERESQISGLQAARHSLGATSEALWLATLEVTALQSRAEEKGRLLEDSRHKLSALEEQAAASETKAGELKEEGEKLRRSHAEEKRPSSSDGCHVAGGGREQGARSAPPCAEG